MGESDNKNNTNVTSQVENSNVIDFTVAKLKYMLNEYHERGLQDVATQVEVALVAYESGKADIKWHNGLPYVKYIAQKS
tara:strand:- start:1 stop:237 length:237 start_codon:yes stop_codon:yes gene_type:complete